MRQIRNYSFQLVLSANTIGIGGIIGGEWVTFGGYTPTLEYMQMFPMNDGKPFTDDYLKRGCATFLR